MKTDKIVASVIGVVVVLAVIVDSLPDSFTSLSNLNSSVKGVGLLKILSVVVAGGLVYAIWKGVGSQRN